MISVELNATTPDGGEVRVAFRWSLEAMRRWHGIAPPGEPTSDSACEADRAIRELLLREAPAALSTALEALRQGLDAGTCLLLEKELRDSKVANLPHG